MMSDAIALHGDVWSWGQCVYGEQHAINEATHELHGDCGAISGNRITGNA
jgi:hypothetical protein